MPFLPRMEIMKTLTKFSISFNNLTLHLMASLPNPWTYNMLPWIYKIIFINDELACPPKWQRKRYGNNFIRPLSILNESIKRRWHT